MSKILLSASLFVLMITWSCSSDKKAKLPAAPASINAVKEEIKGKSYKAEKAGTHSMISTDKEIQWLEPKEDEKFEKGILEDSKTTRINFVNDTAVTVSFKDKTYNGTYSIDDVTKQDEMPGIKIRVSYIDDEFKFGDSPAPKVTYTYIVEGISNNSLLVITPRSMNQRRIVLLMNKQ